MRGVSEMSPEEERKVIMTRLAIKKCGSMDLKNHLTAWMQCQTILSILNIKLIAAATINFLATINYLKLIAATTINFATINYLNFI